MGIFVSDSHCFHLQTQETSYVFQVLENGDLGQLYYGKRIHVKPHYDHLLIMEARGFEICPLADKPAFQPSLIKFEYAGYGKGDFRHPAYQVEDKSGSRITELRFHSYQIKEGKARLAGLPSTFSSGEDLVQELTIEMRDDLAGLSVYLNYAVFPKQDIITRSVRFENTGSASLTLVRALSLQLDLPDADYDFIHFSGAWLRERYLQRHPLHSGIQSIDSLRVSSSPQQNPFFMLAKKHTDEDSGEVYGFNLIYSGNHLEQVEVDHFGQSRLLVGLHPFDFSWELKRGDSFQTPEAIQIFSSKGFNHLSQKLADFYHHHLVNPHFAKKERPVLINSWEATYFDIDSEKIRRFADRAKELGIELLVVDDGWFGKRNDDSSSLGDWFVNREKLPNGLAPVAEYVHSLGLQFGLWFEPEMVSQDSQLYREHPDWRIESPHRAPSLGRKQFVLDFSREEVVDSIFHQLCQVIDETKLDYIKWDMNRHITDLYSRSCPSTQQKEVAHRYILGVYQLFERLTKAYPHILFESCSSGGGRFDLGMMYYAPQAWVSDDTDPVERLKIQFGTSYGYSLSMMANHISTSPNHQSGRVTPMKTRADTAYFGVLGYELDVTRLSEEEIKEIKTQIALYKDYRSLFQFGDFYRLISQFEQNKNNGAWQLVSKDKSYAIAGYYQVLNQLNPSTNRCYFKGLDPEKMYQINGSDEVFYGDELMNAGLVLKYSLLENETVLSTSDFLSYLFILREKRS